MRRYNQCCRSRNLRSVIETELADSVIRPKQVVEQGVALLFDLWEYVAAYLSNLGITDLAELSIADSNRLWAKAELDHAADMAAWDDQMGWDA